MKRYRVYIYDNEEYFDIYNEAEKEYRNVHKGFYLQELCDFASMKHSSVAYLKEYLHLNQVVSERIKSGSSDEALLPLEKIGCGFCCFYNDAVNSFNDIREPDLLSSTWLQQEADKIESLQEEVNTYISNLVFGKRNPLSFQSELNIEVININGENCKVLYPKSIYDIFYFFLFEIVDKDIVFKICKRCDKYFPCLYNKNIQFCDRVDAALDKTCREIKLETLPDTDEVKHKADVMELFKRTYERVRHRVRRTKEQQKKYKEWSKEARSLRDRCISGEITLDYFEEWLSKTEQEMM